MILSLLRPVIILSNSILKKYLFPDDYSVVDEHNENKERITMNVIWYSHKDKRSPQGMILLVSPDFSSTKFFAGRDAGHEAVVSYCKCPATK